MSDFNSAYSQCDHYFGQAPEAILSTFMSEIDPDRPRIPRTRCRMRAGTQHTYPRTQSNKTISIPRDRPFNYRRATTSENRRGRIIPRHHRADRPWRNRRKQALRIDQPPQSVRGPPVRHPPDSHHREHSAIHRPNKTTPHQRGPYLHHRVQHARPRLCATRKELDSHRTEFIPNPRQPERPSDVLRAE